MQAAKIKNYLELATNVAVLLAAIAVLSALSWGYFAQRQAFSLRGGLQKNQVIAKLPTIDYSDAPRTLLIAMNTKCVFCTESISFYNKLAKLEQGESRTKRIIAIFPDEESEVKRYVQQNQLQVETIASVNYQALNVNTTPTMILVDKDGRVLDFWIGKLSVEAEQQALKSIATKGVRAN